MIDDTETERMFGELMHHADPLYTVHDKKEISDWLDHREYGLALETAVDILSEGSLPVAPEIVQRIKVLAIHMGMTEFSVSRLIEE